MDRLRYLYKSNSKPRYFRHIKYPEIPLNAGDLYVITNDGDRLDLLADRFYGNSDLWWIIVQGNTGVLKGDGVALKAGIELRIPSSPEMVLRNFTKLNKKHQ